MFPLFALAVPILKMTSDIMHQDIYIYQDEIGLYQMQLTLAVNEIISVDSYEIVITLKKRMSYFW